MFLFLHQSVCKDRGAPAIILLQTQAFGESCRSGLCLQSLEMFGLIQHVQSVFVHVRWSLDSWLCFQMDNYPATHLSSLWCNSRDDPKMRCLHFHRWTVLCFVFNSHCLLLIFSQYFGYYFHVWRRFATSKHNSLNVQSHIKVTVDLFGTLHFKVIFEVHCLTCSVSLNVFYQCATGR